MKALLCTALLFALPFGASLAQAADAAPQVAPAQHHHRGNPHKAAMRMGRDLHLSPDQQARVEPILAARHQKVEAVRANPQLSDADRHQQLKSIHHESRAQLSSVLSPDQMRQMKAMHHARHAAPTPPTGV